MIPTHWVLVWFGIGVGSIAGLAAYHFMLRPGIPRVDGVPITPCPRCGSRQTRVLITPTDRQASCFLCGNAWDPTDPVPGPTPEPSAPESPEKPCKG